MRPPRTGKLIIRRGTACLVPTRYVELSAIYRGLLGAIWHKKRQSCRAPTAVQRQKRQSCASVYRTLEFDMRRSGDKLGRLQLKSRIRRGAAGAIGGASLVLGACSPEASDEQLELLGTSVQAMDSKPTEEKLGKTKKRSAAQRPVPEPTEAASAAPELLSQRTPSPPGPTQRPLRTRSAASGFPTWPPS